MANKTILALMASAIAAGGFSAAAQNNDVVLTSESISVTEVPDCKVHYYNSWRDGWFIQAGAGVNIAAMEGFRYGPAKVGANYNLGFGRWFSPYMAFRISGNYGNYVEGIKDGNLHFRSASVNADFMWDMLNSTSGVNPNRVFSIVPFVGIGATYNYHFGNATDDINVYNDGYKRTTSWAIPVSAGIQLRLRLSRHVDFFVEGRAIFAGDNFNNIAEDLPIDLAFQGVGGFNINIGGKDFKTYDPCANAAYVASLNNQVNNLRDELAVTAAALSAAESQLPCPEVQPAPAPAPAPAAAPMLTTVRFTLNSAKITPMEMVNVYNVADYLKQNPDTKITITGFADKDTGSAAYNQKLSERRAQAVYDALVNNYGISADRLSKSAEGSSVQPYETNNWNRIVIFSQQ